MSQISNIITDWRTQLKERASFRGVEFHVETGSRTSGRRGVVHEYPKRADELGPYAEDMGKHAIRFPITGYLVYRAKIYNPIDDYVRQRKRLFEALEAPGHGKLIHPVFAPGDGMMVLCERYSMTESRERGGYTVFEMQFVQGGKAVSSAGIAINTQSNVQTQAKQTEQTVTDQSPSQQYFA